MSRLFLFSGILALIAMPQSVRSAEARHPNVLWICGDDHAPYVMGAYGNRQVPTPNLDRLAAEGMRFDAAFTATAMCAPTRQ